jgi:hypothetical protein
MFWYSHFDFYVVLELSFVCVGNVLLFACRGPFLKGKFRAHEEMQVWLGTLVIIVSYEHMQETFLRLLLNFFKKKLLLNHSNIYNAIWAAVCFRANLVIYINACRLVVQSSVMVV